MNSCTYKRRLLFGMRQIGYTLLLLFTAQAQPNSPDRVASAHGVVTDSGSGEGLRKAYLRLASIGKGSQYPVVTHDQGAFVIENVAPGNYRLDVERTGFLKTSAWADIE
jgi:hypothetical protein